MYQIFISYRRSGGEFLGKMLYDSLTQRGYKVFYDVETLRSGKFNDQLLSVIEQCRDFVLLLSPGAMDRCLTDPEDWVLREITWAHKHHKNIIPILMRDFKWPENLTPLLREIKDQEGANVYNEYYDALVDRLCRKLLKSEAAPAVPATRYPVSSRSLITPAVLELTRLLREKKLDVADLDDFICWKWQREKMPGDNKAWWWFRSRDPGEQAELERFFAELYRLDHVYTPDDTGRYLDSRRREPFLYDGQTWQQEDVVTAGDANYMIGFRSGKELLPELGIFQIGTGDALIQIPEGSERYRGVLLAYAMDHRLMNGFAPYCTRIAGDRLPQNEAVEKMTMMELFRSSAIWGDHSYKKFMGKGWAFLDLTLREVKERDAYTRKPIQISPFAKDQQPIDMVDTAVRYESGKRQMMILTVSRKHRGDFFLAGPARVWLVTAKARTAGDYELIFMEVTDYGAVPMGIRERFSLRMALYRATGCIG